MPTYVNNLRLTELNTGEGAGTWGTTTNSNLEFIGEALGFNTQAAFSSDGDATTTVADGATDPARAFYFKVTSGTSPTAWSQSGMTAKSDRNLCRCQKNCTGGKS